MAFVKTDIILCFLAEKEIEYDYRDVAAQRKIILEQFTGEGCRTRELLEELQHSGNFYFDKFCQVKIPSWTKGRVALVGDAGYCEHHPHIHTLYTIPVRKPEYLPPASFRFAVACDTLAIG